MDRYKIGILGAILPQNRNCEWLQAARHGRYHLTVLINSLSFLSLPLGMEARREICPRII